MRVNNLFAIVTWQQLICLLITSLTPPSSAIIVGTSKCLRAVVDKTSVTVTSATISVIHYLMAESEPARSAVSKLFFGRSDCTENDNARLTANQRSKVKGRGQDRAPKPLKCHELWPLYRSPVMSYSFEPIFFCLEAVSLADSGKVRDERSIR